MNSLAKAYLLILHIFLVVILIYSGVAKKLINVFWSEKSSSENGYINFVHDFHLRVDLNTPKCATVFIGDSHIQGLAVADLSKNSVNFGIGMDTAEGVLKRLADYQSDDAACAMVIQVGFNDLFRYDNSEILDNINSILAAQAPTSLVIANAIFPVDASVGDNGFLVLDDALNKRIVHLNKAYKNIAAQYSTVVFVEMTPIFTKSESLLPQFHIGDGIHLSPKGYDEWRKILSATLKQPTKKAM